MSGQSKSESRSYVVDVPVGTTGYEPVSIGTVRLPVGKWEVTHSTGGDSLILIARRLREKVPNSP